MSLDWSALEMLASQIGPAAAWRRHLGDSLDLVLREFLRPTSKLAPRYPCPKGCGCWHDVVELPDGRMIAACRCPIPECKSFPVTREDLVMHYLEIPALGVAVGRALGLYRSGATELSVADSVQIGTCGRDATPVVLAVMTNPLSFRRALCELAVLLGKPFPLIVPSLRNVDTQATVMARSARVLIVPMQGNFTLLPSGIIQALRPAEEILGEFAAPREEEHVGEDLALQAFQIVQKLDGERPCKSPSPLTVFRLYCIEGLNASRIARRLGCAKGTVVNRMALLRQRLGCDLDQFRAYAPQFEKLEDDIAESRARIHRRSLLG